MLKSRKIKVLLLVFIVVIGVFFRFLHLTADPPTDITISGGVIGDPGQYSLPARNKILFGVWAIEGWKTQWLSPAILYVNYYIYKILGISLFTHRLVPFIFSSLTLIFIVFFILYKGNYLLALFFSIFYSFNYPSIIYSKIANREFPMIFFFIMSAYFFALGSKKKKNYFFIISAVFFMLSYLSKGSVLYFVSVFIFIGLLWLIEKRVSITNIIAFFLPLGSLFLMWYFYILLPNKQFFSLFYKNNFMVRRMQGIKGALFNLWTSPFLVIMRNDWILIIISFIGIIYYIYKKLFLREKLNEFLEVSVIWFSIGLVANGIVSYRPTRFFISLIIPYLLISSFFLKDFFEGKIEWNKKLTIFFVILFPLLSYIGGASLFIRKNNKFQIFFYLLLFTGILFYYAISKKESKYTFIFTVVFISLTTNAYFLYRWNNKVTYKIEHISFLLSKIIPPSNIAGNWASILSIGTPHKTFYTWPGFANSDKDFLRKNKVKYIILAKGRFANELSMIKDYFKKDFEKAKLMAIFSLYNTKLYLFSLANENQDQSKIEFETLYFNNRYRKIVFDSKASQKMAIKLSRKARNIEIHPKLIFNSTGKIVFVGKGNFRVTIKFLKEGERREIIKNFRIKGYKYKKKKLTLPLNKKLQLKEIKVYKIRSSAFLDYLFLN